jgi:thiol-disulfide isomerase/thioredoxin
MILMLKWFKVLFAALFLVGCSNSEVSDGPLRIEPFKNGDKIVLNNIHGGSKTLLRTNDGFVIEGEEKKVLMIDLFGTFCKPCQEEAPALTDLQLRKSDDFILIGLTHLEEVTDEYVLEHFAQKYGAFYFIANSKDNARIAETITQDIGYKQALQVPFKVMLKDAKYQQVTDVWENKPDNRYYIGKIDTKIIEEDLMRILEGK